MDAHNSAQSGRSMGWWLVATCFLLSGFAGLLYETVWLRQFAAVFGTSEAALGAVLAATMAGLALGAVISARYATQIRRPVLAYGLLELGVAVGALLVPFGLQIANGLRIWICGGQPELPAAGGMLEVLTDSLLVFVLVLLPTGCMGATLPMLARFVVGGGDRRDTGRIGLLYGINTFGAVFGTLVTAFWLVPSLGLQTTVFVGAGINVVVFALAAVLQKTLPTTSNEPVAADEILRSDSSIHTRTKLEQSARAPSLAALALLIGFASAASFTYEVLWTRLLSQVLGGSLFAFSTMLAGFLTGIALGSCLAVRLVRRGHPVLRLLLHSQAAAALATVVMFAGIDVVPFVSQWIGSGLTGGFVANVTLCLAVLLPSTIAIGMSLPLAIEVAGRGQSNLSQVTGRLYAAGTLGAIAGSLLCGHLLLPWLGFHGTVAVAASINLGVASCVLFWERPERRHVPIAISIPAVIAALLVVGGPDAMLRYRPLHNIVAPRTVVFSQVGASANVMLSHEEFGFRLLCNGLPEALIAPRGAVGGASDGARWLAALPVLARPDAKSMLVIGLGGGSLVEGVPETIESIDTVELEPKVVAAIREISNERAHDPLSDPRLRLVINDARGALSLSSKSYDAIVSQPSHPWTAGASHLYTREFMQLAHSHLNANGVLLQWMNSKYADEGQVRSLGATLRDVFSHVRVYQPTEGLLLFLASDSSLQVEEQIIQTGRPLRSGLRSFRWIGVNDVHDVAAALLMDEPALQEFCAGAPIITDNDNRLATGSSRRPGESFTALNPEVFRRSDALIHRSGARPLTDRIGLDAAKLVRVLLLSKQEARARMIAESLSGKRHRLLADGYVSLYTGDFDTATARFRAVLESNPNDRDARFKLTEVTLPQIATGQISQTIQLASHAVSLKSPIVAAATAYYSQDWQQLQFLDGQLGTAAPGDTWLALSLTFRAAWRTKVVDENRRQRYGEEALELIDRAIVIEPTVFASIVRLQAAEQTGRVEPWLESAVYLAHLFEKQSHTVTPKMARAVSRQVLAKVATITPATSWQEDRCSTIRHLYQQIQAAGQK